MNTETADTAVPATRACSSLSHLCATTIKQMQLAQPNLENNIVVDMANKNKEGEVGNEPELLGNEPELLDEREEENDANDNDDMFEDANDMFASPLSTLNNNNSSDESGAFQAVQGGNGTAGNTPAITKMKQTRKDFHVYSPSDQLMSPCTRKLEKCRVGGVAFSHPQHILRTRQHEGVQLAAAKSVSTSSSQPMSSSGCASSSSSSAVDSVPLAEPFEGVPTTEKQNANANEPMISD